MSKVVDEDGDEVISGHDIYESVGFSVVDGIQTNPMIVPSQGNFDALVGVNVELVDHEDGTLVLKAVFPLETMLSILAGLSEALAMTCDIVSRGPYKSDLLLVKQETLTKQAAKMIADIQRVAELIPIITTETSMKASVEPDQVDSND